MNWRTSQIQDHFERRPSKVPEHPSSGSVVIPMKFLWSKEYFRQHSSLCCLWMAQIHQNPLCRLPDERLKLMNSQMLKTELSRAATRTACGNVQCISKTRWWSTEHHTVAFSFQHSAVSYQSTSKGPLQPVYRRFSEISPLLYRRRFSVFSGEYILRTWILDPRSRLQEYRWISPATTNADYRTHTD